MSGYESSEWIEPGTMRRVQADGTVSLHKVGPELGSSGPGITWPAAGPPEWWLEAMAPAFPTWQRSAELQWQGTYR